MRRDFAIRATMLALRTIARRVRMPTTLGVEGEITAAQALIIPACRTAQSRGVVLRLVLNPTVSPISDLLV
jgi:hypothetical protein